MASWVAPAVAAEIWGVGVDQVLAGIANGSIQSFVDGQFLFVDMAGNGYARSTPRPQPAEPVVTPNELQALTYQPISEVNNSSVENENFTEDDEDDSSHDISLWRTAREQASHLRRPPQAEAA
ncbi:MAG TPA: hypothetical protein VHX86_16485 [Tepidisphaeraceae bacterium]|nr:hypothetical protein [Tepidisphaeraceae bacterium]